MDYTSICGGGTVVKYLTEKACWGGYQQKRYTEKWKRLLLLIMGLSTDYLRVFMAYWVRGELVSTSNGSSPEVVKPSQLEACALNSRV